MSANCGWSSSIAAVSPCTWVGPGSTPGLSRLTTDCFDVAVGVEGERREADDPRLTWPEARRLDVDDGPARAGLAWPADPRNPVHDLRMARRTDIAGSLRVVSRAEFGDPLADPSCVTGAVSAALAIALKLSG